MNPNSTEEEMKHSLFARTYKNERINDKKFKLSG